MTKKNERLPAFVVVGAVKAATTWLAHQLRSHPMLWLPEAEPRFFSVNHDQGLAWYLRQFGCAPAQALLGEKSADCLQHPEAAERIARILPGARLIVQLRDPVARAYSEYCMLYRRGEIDGDVARHLDPRDNRGSRLIEGGCYAAHLRRLFDHVAAANVKVILYDDIVREPVRVAAGVFAHIGVPAHIAPDAIMDRRNDGNAALLPLGLRKLLRPARPLLDPLRAVPILAEARARIARPVSYPPISPAVKARLRDFYRDDIAALSVMLDRDLTGWLVDEAVAA